MNNINLFSLSIYGNKMSVDIIAKNGSCASCIICISNELKRIKIRQISIWNLVLNAITRKTFVFWRVKACDQAIKWSLAVVQSRLWYLWYNWPKDWRVKEREVRSEWLSVMAAPTSQRFDTWLSNKLLQLNQDVDLDVFVSYITGILEDETSDEDKNESLSGIIAEIFVRISHCNIYTLFNGRRNSSGFPTNNIFCIRRGRFSILTNNIFYYSSGGGGGRLPTDTFFCYSSGTIHINKIMFFGILFNSCFSLFNSFIEMTTREIHFNKESFLKTLKTSQFI